MNTSITDTPKEESTLSADKLFENTEVAFAEKNDTELKHAYRLFKLMDKNWLIKIGNPLLLCALKLRLPIDGMIKSTVFDHFCGGETVKDAEQKINRLAKFGIETALDYGVEAKQEEKDFEHVANEIINNANIAKNNQAITFLSLKMTGIANIALLEKITKKESLNESEKQAFERARKRLDAICNAVAKAGISIYIDAEESWIQQPVDDLTMEMTEQYNKERAVVFNTLQMYRTDRLNYLEACYNDAVKNNFVLGIKFVRGAYLEKEQRRAAEKNYPSPVYFVKKDTDNNFNAGLEFCVKHIDRIAVCAATHNEDSCLLLMKLMKEANIAPQNKSAYFSQLYGMSDHISYNLGKAGYHVSKYLPYAPVKAVMPYLLRRSKENTSMSGQMGRELRLLTIEMKRRKLL